MRSCPLCDLPMEEAMAAGKPVYYCRNPKCEIYIRIKREVRKFLAHMPEPPPKKS